eukprot:3707333-Rhodomonas_salina.1
MGRLLNCPLLCPQSQFRAHHAQDDRWARTGGTNPGPPHGFYPPRRQPPPSARAGKPVQAKALAQSWGNPAAAPSFLAVRARRSVGPTLSERASYTPAPPLPPADGDDRGVRARMQGYSRSRVRAVLGLHARTAGRGDAEDEEAGAARGEGHVMGKRQVFGARKRRGGGQ